MPIVLHWSRNSFTILSKPVNGFGSKGAAQKTHQATDYNQIYSMKYD